MDRLCRLGGHLTPAAAALSTGLGDTDPPLGSLEGLASHCHVALATCTGNVQYWLPSCSKPPSILAVTYAQ